MAGSSAQPSGRRSGRPSGRPRILISSGTADVPIAEGFLPSHYVGEGYAVGDRRRRRAPSHRPERRRSRGRDRSRSHRSRRRAPARRWHGPRSGDIRPADRRGAHATSRHRTLTGSRPHSSAERGERGIPILGVCRGFQMLNVAYGGTLDQHRPHQSSEILDHPSLRIECTEVSLEPGSLVARGRHRPHLGVLPPPPGDRRSRKRTSHDRDRTRRTYRISRRSRLANSSSASSGIPSRCSRAPTPVPSTTRS